MAPVDWPVDRQRDQLSSSGLGRPGDRSTGRPTTPTVWPLAVDRQVISDLFWTPTAIFSDPYKNRLFLPRFLSVIFPIFSSVFNKVFKRVFVPKLHIFIYFQSFEKSKKNKFWESSLLFYISHIISRVFPSISLCVSFSKSLFTHILELFIVNLSSRILYCDRFCLWSFEITK